MNPPSATHAALAGKCPRCRRGKLFTDGPYSRFFQRMYPDCPHCGLHYEIETGFFWGAMYINYGFTVATFIASFVAMQVLAPTAPVWYTIALLAGLLVVLLPVYIRLSRILMLYWFGSIRFDPALHTDEGASAQAQQTPTNPT